MNLVLFGLSALAFWNFLKVSEIGTGYLQPSLKDRAELRKFSILKRFSVKYNGVISIYCFTFLMISAFIFIFLRDVQNSLLFGLIFMTIAVLLQNIKLFWRFL